MLFCTGMQNIGIETAQNVTLHHEVASLGDRIVAYLIDALIIYSWLILWGFIMADLDWATREAFFPYFMVIALLPLLFYHLVCEITMDGQSVGKRTRKIRVVRMDGGQPTMGNYLLRWVLRPVDNFYFIGLIVILVNGRGQRLGDLAAGTTLISLKPRLKLQDTLIAEAPASHEVRFPEAINLNDAQVALIREVLRNTHVADRWALIDELAEKVRTVIGNRGDGLRSMEFLQAVLADHVALATQQAERTAAFATSR